MWQNIVPLDRTYIREEPLQGDFQYDWTWFSAANNKELGIVPQKERISVTAYKYTLINGLIVVTPYDPKSNLPWFPPSKEGVQTVRGNLIGQDLTSDGRVFLEGLSYWQGPAREWHQTGVYNYLTNNGDVVLSLSRSNVSELLSPQDYFLPDELHDISWQTEKDDGVKTDVTFLSSEGKAIQIYVNTPDEDHINIRYESVRDGNAADQNVYKLGVNIWDKSNNKVSNLRLSHFGVPLLPVEVDESRLNSIVSRVLADVTSGTYQPVFDYLTTIK